MITLFILWLIFGKKDNTSNGFNEEEEDFEEMYMMGMFDEDV